MSFRFVITNADGGIVFRLESPRQQILESRPYRTLCDAERGIELVRRNCGSPDRFRRVEAEQGKWQIEVLSTPRHVIARSPSVDFKELARLEETMLRHAPSAAWVDIRPNRRGA